MNEKNDKKVPYAFLQYVKRNWFAICLCIAAAVVMWGLILKNENPDRVKTITNVQPVFQGEADLLSRQLVVVGDRKVVLPPLSVKVTTDLLNYAKLDEKDITASVDLRKIGGTGEYELSINATSSVGTVMKVIPDTITVTIDKFNSKTVPVEITTSKNMGKGLEKGEIEVSKDSITIEGAYSIINSIVKAYYDVDLSNVKESLNESVSLTLLDADNNAVSTNEIYGEVPSVKINMPVYSYKELEFDIKDCLVNDDLLNQNYEIVSYYTVPENVKVLSSDGESLDDLQKIKLKGKIDLTGAKSNITRKMDFSLSDGFWLDEDIKSVEVHVIINEKQVEKTFAQVPIIISGENNDYEYSYIVRSVDVTIKCGISLANEIEREDIKLFASVKDIEPSNEECYAPIKYELSGNIDQTDVFVSLSHEKIKFLVIAKTDN